MPIDPSILEELRDDCKYEAYHAARFERLMQHNDEDEEFFSRTVDERLGIVEMLTLFKKYCKDYNRDPIEELGHFLDMA